MNSPDRERTRHGEPWRDLLNQSAPRRRFNETLGAIGLLAGFGATLGVIALEAERGPEVLKGKPITGEVKPYVTRMSGSNLPLLRDEPSLSPEDEIGTVEPGIIIKVMEIRDTPYPHNPHDDLCGVAEDGNVYCVWYKLIDPVLVRRNDGPVELRTGFLAGNFLRNPTEEELQIQQ